MLYEGHFEVPAEIGNRIPAIENLLRRVNTYMSAAPMSVRHEVVNVRFTDSLELLRRPIVHATTQLLGIAGTASLPTNADPASVRQHPSLASSPQLSQQLFPQIRVPQWG